MAEKMSKTDWDKRRKARVTAAKAKLPETGILELTLQDQTIRVEVQFREFSSGSVGYFGQVRGSHADLPLAGNVNLIVSGTAPYKG